MGNELTCRVKVREAQADADADAADAAWIRSSNPKNRSSGIEGLRAAQSPAEENFVAGQLLARGKWGWAARE